MEDLIELLMRKPPMPERIAGPTDVCFVGLDIGGSIRRAFTLGLPDPEPWLQAHGFEKRDVVTWWKCGYFDVGEAAMIEWIASVQ